MEPVCFGFIFNKLNLATSKPKILLKNQKVISNHYLSDAGCNDFVYESQSI